jgi:hypothetical protein
MKKIHLLVALLALTAVSARAETTLALGTDADSLSNPLVQSNAPSLQPLSLAINSNNGSNLAFNQHSASSTANFAELNDGGKSMPLPPAWSLGLILLVLVARVFGLNHARALADHEKETHRAKTQMYRSLQNRA